MRRSLLHLVLLASVGCTLAPVDLEGRACPCAPGWTCDPARQVCVEGAFDAGAFDAGSGDGGSGDAGAFDAGSGDAGSSDGGSSEAGTDDAGEGDAGPDGDAGPRLPGHCASREGDLFCDGFEDRSTAGWTGVRMEGGTLVGQGDRVYAGEGALRVTTTAAGARVNVSASYPQVFFGTLYARGYYFIPSSVDVRALSLLYVGEAVAPFTGIAVQALGEGMQIFVGTAAAPVISSSLQMPRDRWVCLQLEIEVHNGQGDVTATVDGTSFGNPTRMDTQPGNGFASVIAGVEFAPAEQGPAEVFVDEVIVSRSPIACD